MDFVIFDNEIMSHYHKKWTLLCRDNEIISQNQVLGFSTMLHHHLFNLWLHWNSYWYFIFSHSLQVTIVSEGMWAVDSLFPRQEKSRNNNFCALLPALHGSERHEWTIFRLLWLRGRQLEPGPLPSPGLDPTLRSCSLCSIVNIPAAPMLSDVIWWYLMLSDGIWAPPRTTVALAHFLFLTGESTRIRGFWRSTQSRLKGLFLFTSPAFIYIHTLHSNTTNYYIRHRHRGNGDLHKMTSINFRRNFKEKQRRQNLGVALE